MAMKTPHYDVIIVGGGIMGSSLAYYLTKAETDLRVAVFERDNTYAKASTALSMANARIQFSLRENVQISLYALEVLAAFERDMRVEDRTLNIAYRREGNLFMVDEAGLKDAQTALAMQRDLGCRVKWWSVDEIRQHYPLYDPTGYVGGTFGAADGHFDAYAVLMGYRNKARAQGAKYIKDDVTAVSRDNGSVEGIRTRSGDRFLAPTVVNCAGAWAAPLAATIDVALPVQPIKRQVFSLDPAVKPSGPLPLTVLPSGLYFRTETGNQILLGKSMGEDPVGYDFSWDDKRFTEVLWFELAQFVPAFDTLKLLRGWAGLYAVNTLDGNAILGEWPECRGFFLANGFSGHGLQQAPAVGRYLTELITGRPHRLDLSIFSPGRVLENKPLSEAGLV